MTPPVTIRYSRVNGDQVAMEFLQPDKDNACLTMSINGGPVIRRAILVKPFRQSAALVAKRWMRNDQARKK